MSRSGHTCLAGCGKVITYTFAICANCECKYGKSPNTWPQWLAFLWRDEQRLRRQHKRVNLHEVSFSDLPRNVANEERQELGYGESGGASNE